MPDTMEVLLRDFVNKHKLLTAEERREAHWGLSPEERLNGLSPEEAAKTAASSLRWARSSQVGRWL